MGQVDVTKPTLIDEIRKKQQDYLDEFSEAPQTPPPPHEPEMLLMGCVDARINVKDIGIPDGKALIYRSVGATVDGLDTNGNAIDKSEAAAIDFAVNVMDVKDIVIMGHTNCGGMGACLQCGAGHAHGFSHLITDYLEPFIQVAKDVLGIKGIKNDEKHQRMERAAIVQSVHNLMSYPFVREKVQNGELRIHGWVMNTGTKLIEELVDKDTGKFQPMARPMSAAERLELGKKRDNDSTALWR